MYFIGIDLGGKKKKTTALCVLKHTGDRSKIVINKLITGSRLWTNLYPYLSQTKVIAVDAPLTKGKGKGQMRLWEKFFSTGFFRKYHLNPFPPAMIPQLTEIGLDLARRLRQYGFRINRDIIEVFPTFSNQVCRKTTSPQQWETSHQNTAYFCAWQAYLHYKNETFWIGYKDGYLFLPDMKYWKKIWQKRFIRNWLGRDRLRYKFLRVSVREFV